MADHGSGRRCAVVGHPVAHSLSPTMHRAAYAVLGLDWTFEAVDVAPGELPAHVDALDASWRALAVTAPHKRDALDLADSVTDVARAAGGANTLLLEQGPRGRHVRADNTDVPGARAALSEAGVVDVPVVRVLGAGATAASVAHAVAGLEARVLDASPSPTGPVDLLVSTVPESVAGERADAWAADAAAVFDVVYDPWPTRLSVAARAAGRPVVTGLDLLAHQAVLQLRLMTGASVDVDVVRGAALEVLASA